MGVERLRLSSGLLFFDAQLVPAGRVKETLGAQQTPGLDVGSKPVAPLPGSLTCGSMSRAVPAKSKASSMLPERPVLYGCFYKLGVLAVGVLIVRAVPYLGSI